MRSPRNGNGSDVLVIGGGIIGLVTAWRAAQRGLSTAVADPEPGGGAARVAAGMLAAVTELHYGEQLLLGLNLASAARYPAFVAELEAASGRETGFRACGTWPSRWTPTTAPSCGTCTPSSCVRGWSRSGSPAASAVGWSRCSRRACAAVCGSTATTRSIRAGWPPPC